MNSYNNDASQHHVVDMQCGVCCCESGMLYFSNILHQTAFSTNLANIFQVQGDYLQMILDQTGIKMRSLDIWTLGFLLSATGIMVKK